jgi:hypothetical protein
VASPADTIMLIAHAATWDERVNRVRQIPARHGTDEHAAILAQVAKLLYVPHLAPDYAYIHSAPFYELPHFQDAYDVVVNLTENFTKVSVDELAADIEAAPTVLLPLRVITGLTRTEFAASTVLVAGPLGMKPLTANKVDSMERRGTATSGEQALVAAETISQIMAGAVYNCKRSAQRGSRASAFRWTTTAFSIAADVVNVPGHY